MRTLQVFPVLLEYQGTKNVLGFFVCHSQYSDSLGLIINIQYLIPGWSLGWLSGFLTELQDPLPKARTLSRVALCGFLQCCPLLSDSSGANKEVVDLLICFSFVRCLDQLL